MSCKASLTVRGTSASWYTPAAGQENRNVAAEAYQNAIRLLKLELGTAGCMPISEEHHASIHDISAVVEKAQQNYTAGQNEHTGARKWLEKLSSRIMYYGRVFDMLAQHHPEYVALAWGAIKLVLTGIINRAELVQKVSQALVAIGDVLPRAELSAELYQTEYMEAALSRLYTYVIMFFQLCVRWYNRSSLGRLWASFKTPFELDYKDLVEQIRVCSHAVEDLANAGARAEIRNIRVLLELHHARAIEQDAKLLELQNRLENSMTQLMQVATSHKSITERMSGDVRGIREGVSRIEFHHVLQFFAPKVLPSTALDKVRSFACQNPTTSLPNCNATKIHSTLRDWVSNGNLSLLVVQVGPRAQKQAKELTSEVIGHLSKSGQRVFFNIYLTHSADSAQSISEVLQNIIFQVLQLSGELFAEFAEQLNLSKIQGSHTEGEWADLLSLLFSKLPQAFVVIETEDLDRFYRRDPAWTERFLKLFQKIVDRATASANEIKVLLVMYGGRNDIKVDAPREKNMVVTMLQPLTPVPPRLRHVARRSGLSTKGWMFRKPKI
ncbi:hypothetical protein BDV96DRAFT_600662 [Lophiotrema nucula]|uniref:NWD NACHT-NTPase N-terminal domain-containing protein n=1 Tax=Lophiotrema nucula TaxID=690887 RepID=A0A6A5Z4G5_9PLEO|nr:hypothetical protein BDV96DRAFT_600662 [Lophiotrema nucula]